METNQKEPGKMKLMLGVIVALLLILSVALYFSYSGSKDNNELTAQKATLDANFKSLSDTLDVRSAEIDRITAKNVKLDSNFVASQAIVADEKKQISGLLSKVKLTKSELAEAKTMIAQYETSISDLQKRVVELVGQNQELTQENHQLSTDLNSEKKNSAQLNEENKGLAKKVDIGSLLQLTAISVDGIKDRQNGKEVVVKNSKAVESLRVSFETGQNKVLSNGPLSFYVRIINPRGETISAANRGSGTFNVAETNTAMQYTKKADIDWNQANKKVIVYWKQNMTTAGIYKVEIYQSCYLVGKGEVKLN